MGEMASDIRRIARELFDGKRVDLLVGFEKGSDGYRSRPVFIESAEGADRLTWDATCSQNLAVYLPSLFRREPQKKGPESAAPRVAFIAKACDLRSLFALVKEKQAPRENLFIIGVPCKGLIDSRKLEKVVMDRAGGVEVTELADGEETIHVHTADGRTFSFAREPLVQDSCLDCQFPAPKGADVSIEGLARQVRDNGSTLLKEFARLSETERWQKFREEISRCIRCYACRQACPMCYCTECFAETNNPAWIGVTTELTDTMIFHIVRIFHQAGRCVECDACVRACPMGIDLRPFTKKIAADVQELFGFTPGFDLETPPPLVTFREDDQQGFITEPRKG
jgi:formate dehydrogenase subunit beta